MMGVKNSKRWCAAPCGRDVPIWEKFDYEDDKDKRVYLPEFKMQKSHVAYIREAARRHKISPSCELERIFTRIFSYGMLNFAVVLCKRNGKKRRVPPHTPKNSVKRPKYTVHPSFIRLITNEEEKKDISISLVVYEIFLIDTIELIYHDDEMIFI